METHTFIYILHHFQYLGRKEDKVKAQVYPGKLQRGDSLLGYWELVRKQHLRPLALKDT